MHLLGKEPELPRGASFHQAVSASYSKPQPPLLPLLLAPSSPSPAPHHYPPLVADRMSAQP